MFAPHLAHVDLPLILEPLQPETEDEIRGRGGWKYGGWHQQNGATVRNHEHDARGALIQHAICRYVLGNVPRGQLAREYGYGVRQIQGFISGQFGVSYGRPVLACLHEMGIPVGRGSIQTKQGAIIRAQSRLISEAMTFASFQPCADRRERYQWVSVATRLLSFVEMS